MKTAAIVLLIASNLITFVFLLHVIIQNKNDQDFYDKL